MDLEIRSRARHWSSSLRPKLQQPATPSRPSIRNIWRFLLGITESRGLLSDVKFSQQQISGRLKHFQPGDFDVATLRTSVGEGASYRVYKGALNENFDRRVVAIKRLKLNSFGSDPTAEDSAAVILRELHLLTHAPLQNHPNIAGVIGYTSEFAATPEGDSIVDNIELSIVVDFAARGTLAQFLANARQDAITLDVKACLMHDVASGIAALHACDIVQGDVKLENTLVFDDPAGDGRYIAKLSDFGYAIAGASTSTEPYIGTGWMNAPEIRSKYMNNSIAPEKIDIFKSDVFSLGLLMWEILLDGKRYVPEVFTFDGEWQYENPSEWLDPLPTDSLLQRALATLELAKVGVAESTSNVLRKALQSSLRDSPSARAPIQDIVSFFKAEKLFRDKFRVAISKPEPLSAYDFEKQIPENEDDDLIFNLPIQVQTSILSQIEGTLDNHSRTDTQRGDASYYLAMAKLVHDGGTSKTVQRPLDLLQQAASLGNQYALGVCFRLHKAILGEVPAQILALDDPLICLEKELDQLPPGDYFRERILRMERIYGRSFSEGHFDLFEQDVIIVENAKLSAIFEILSSRSSFNTAHLKCAYCDDGPSRTKGLLLHAACLVGYLDLVKLLIERSTRDGVWNLNSESNETPLVTACRGGQFEVVAYLRNTYHAEISSFDTSLSFKGVCALHWLMMFSVDEIERLLQLFLESQKDRRHLRRHLIASVPEPGINIQFTKFVRSPLSFAISINHLPLVKLLLAVSSKVQAEEGLKTLPGWNTDTFGLAVGAHLPAMVSLLLPYEIEFRKATTEPEILQIRRSQGRREYDPFGLFDIGNTQNPLGLFLMHGSNIRSTIESTVDCLLNAKVCDINQEDSDGYTPLAHAVRRSPREIVMDIISVLTARGARFGSSLSPREVFSYCINKRKDAVKVAILKFLLDHDILKNTSELLEGAIVESSAPLVDVILAYGGQDINVDICYYEEKTLNLHIAATLPDGDDVVNTLLDHGADIDILDGGVSALELAIFAAHSSTKIIDVLISRGASLLSQRHGTILHFAARCSNQINGMHVIHHILQHDRVKESLNKGPNPEGFTPLDIACVNAEIEAVQALLSEGAEVVGVRTEGEQGIPGTIDFVLAMGKRPNLTSYLTGEVKDEEAISKWRLACREMLLLLRDHADPDHGRTPLHIAAEIGDLQSIKYLVERQHASVFIGDRDRVNPIGVLESIPLLEKNGESEAYIANVKQIKDYLTLAIIREVDSINNDSEKLEALHYQLSSQGDEGEPLREIENRLSELKIIAENKDKPQAIIRDGSKSYDEIEAESSEVVKKLQESHGKENLQTLDAMDDLWKTYGLQSKWADAEKLQLEVYTARQKQLSAYEFDMCKSTSDRVRLLIRCDRFEEAYDLAQEAFKFAHDNFNIKDTRRNFAVADVSYTFVAQGLHDLAIDYLKMMLDEEHYFQQYKFSRLEWYNLIRGLVRSYCAMNKLSEARSLIDGKAYFLEFAKPEEFLECFATLEEIVKTLHEVNMWREVGEMLSEIATICEKRHSRAAPCTIRAQDLLANHYRGRTMWKEAGEVVQGMVSNIEADLGRDHILVFRFTAELGEIRTNEKRFAEAEILLRRALGAAETHQYHPHDILITKRNLAQVLQLQRQLDEAEKLSREVVDGFREADPDSEDLVLAQFIHGSTLYLMKRFEEATAVEESIMNQRLQAFGESDTRTWQAMKAVCQSRCGEQRWADAESLCRRMIGFIEGAAGQGNPKAFSAYLLLARIRKALGDHDEAMSALIHVIEASPIEGVDHQKDKIEALITLSDYQIELENFSEAIPSLEQALATISRAYNGEPHTYSLIAESSLGFVYNNLDKPEEALKPYENALSGARQLLGDQDPDTIDKMVDLVQIYKRLERFEDAIPIGHEVLDYNEKKLGWYHETTMYSKLALAEAYSGAERWNLAERMWRDYLRFVKSDKKDLPNCEEESINCMDYLVEACMEQKRFKEAEEFARTILEYRLRVLGDSHEDSLSARVSLAKILVKMKKLDEAEKLTKDALSIAEKRIDDDDGDFEYQLENARSHLALIWFEQDRLEEARDLQLQVVASDEDDATEQVFLCDIYIKLKQYTEAEAIILELLAKHRAAAEGDKSDPAVLNDLDTLVDLYVSMERWAEARDVGEELLKGRMEGRGFEADLEVSSVLRTLKPIYAALGDEARVLEDRTLTQERARIRRSHATMISVADHLYENRNDGED